MPTHGERLAVLETIQGALVDDVAQVRRDIKSFGETLGGQLTDLKKTMLTKAVETNTRAAVWKGILSKIGWIIGQAVIIFAAILGSSWVHIKW